MTTKDMNSTFLSRAAAPRVSLFRDIWDFLRTNKQWWLLPILFTLLLLGGLVMLSSGGLAPFIYTLF